ncbi:MAG: 4Fe-4S ferredoxin [Anaerolineales bacterium]|nr:4Fe-4S dicluster domain-containing protein [Anaerolineae bacterium]PWB69613.1 MAG: 4Fe-4S ferredoxin [Anaerolineales bacterium]
MTNYGFLIDQSKCIGCHACSTACKSENQVPLGVYRTWVKYVETGAYPDVHRSFQVTRCNHCANPPCVRICPVSAMYQRDDGIVEFDPSICIGCKSCMQACPYDSIYLDPETNTAAKCHFCAHRLDVGLEPACVVVCPEHAIVAGDLNDPASEISRKLSTAQATVRKPEQGTGPKLFYINGNDWSLHPTASPTNDSYMWADKVTKQNTTTYVLPVVPAGRVAEGVSRPKQKISKSGTPIRTPQDQGRPLNGPIQIGGRVAGQMVQTAYTAQHKINWHWELPAYLVTKSIAGGLFMLLCLGSIFNLFPFNATTFLATGFTAMVFMLITVILLIKDLSQPKRFLNILLRPQWKSWVARGAFILIGFTAFAGLWWLIEGAAQLNWLSGDIASSLRPIFAWITLPLALFSVIYTAFLLGQAEGRDMWQTPLLPFQLLSQSAMVASGVFIALGLFVRFSNDLFGFLSSTFLASLVINLLITLAGKFAMPHASEISLLASREMSHGKFRNHFWWGGIGLGHVLPLALFAIPSMLPLAVFAAIVGLFFYEYAFVMAPQHIPNS